MGLTSVLPQAKMPKYYINDYTLTVTKDLALYIGVTEYDASYSSPQNAA